MLLLLPVLFGYTRCDTIEPPTDPVVISVDPAGLCRRNDFVQIAGSRFENTVTGEILDRRAFAGVPDVSVSLEPRQCFRIPDCYSVEPTGLGYFRTSGFDFVDRSDEIWRSTGDLPGQFLEGGFPYFMTAPLADAARTALSEFPDGEEPEDAVLFCAQDDALPTAEGAAWRGFFVLGQTADDRLLNGISNQNGFSTVRFEIAIAEAGSGGSGGDGSGGDGSGGDGSGGGGGDDPSGPFELSSLLVTPVLSTTSPPWITEEVELTLQAAASEPIGSIEVSVENCSPATVSDCDPLLEAPPMDSSEWSVTLPRFSAGAGGTAQSTLNVRVADATGSRVATESVELQSFPADGAVALSCTKAIDANTGDRIVDFDVVPLSPPVDASTGLPYELGDLFDVRILISEYTLSQGYVLDETSATIGGFSATDPLVANVGNDGRYQAILSGLYGFTEPVQAVLIFDTDDGAPLDLCN